MSIIPKWPFVVGALVIGFAGGAYADHVFMSGRIAKIEADHAEVMRQLAEIQVEDERINRNKEQDLTKRIGEVEQEKANEKSRITTLYANQLSGLLQRADRRPAPASGMPEAASSCAGSTGAELSRPDAIFLIGVARRADEQRAALAACYSAYEAMK